MGTLNAIYIRAQGALIESTVRRIFPEAKAEAGPGFTGFTLDDDAFEPPKEALVRLSEDLGTDVIWLGFQSAVDAFQFHHWNAGSRLRSLVFGCYGDERTWDIIDGQPEPWERTAFFDSESLKYPLQYAPSDEVKRELERIWREAELVPGRTEPSIDARESAWKAAEHYQLPGWA